MLDNYSIEDSLSPDRSKETITYPNIEKYNNLCLKKKTTELDENEQIEFEQLFAWISFMNDNADFSISFEKFSLNLKHNAGYIEKAKAIGSDSLESVLKKLKNVLHLIPYFSEEK